MGGQLDRWLSPYPHLNLPSNFLILWWLRCCFLQFSTKLESSKHCSCLLFWVWKDCYLSTLVYAWGGWGFPNQFFYKQKVILVDHFIWTCPIFWLHFVHSKGIQVSLSHARKLLLTEQPQVSQQHPGPLSCSFPCLLLFWMIRSSMWLAYQPLLTILRAVEQSVKFPIVLPPSPILNQRSMNSQVYFPNTKKQ